MEQLIHLHLHPNRLNRDFNIFLLFLPIIAFIVVLAFLVGEKGRGQMAATNTEPTVLGQEAP